MRVIATRHSSIACTLFSEVRGRVASSSSIALRVRDRLEGVGRWIRPYVCHRQHKIREQATCLRGFPCAAITAHLRPASADPSLLGMSSRVASMFSRRSSAVAGRARAWMERLLIAFLRARASAMQIRRSPDKERAVRLVHRTSTSRSLRRRPDALASPCFFCFSPPARIPTTNTHDHSSRHRGCSPRLLPTLLSNALVYDFLTPSPFPTRLFPLLQTHQVCPTLAFIYSALCQHALARRGPPL